MKQFIFVLVAIGIFSITTACGQGFTTTSLNSVAEDIGNGVACPQSRDLIFDAYYRTLSENQKIDEGDIRSSVKNFVSSKTDVKAASEKQQSRFENSVALIHSILTTELRNVRQNVSQSKVSAAGDEFVPESENDEMLHLSRLEMRSRIDPQYETVNGKLDIAIAEAAEAAKDVGISCQTPVGAPAPQVPEDQTSQVDGRMPKTHPLYGARYTMAASYQSCTVLSLPPILSSTAPAQGFAKGAKIDAVGYGRVYTDVALLKRTHYYHRGQSYGAGCADQSQKPLIYDYGGIPAIGVASLDMFKNAGGGPALGIDCSAYISTAAAVSGNLYKPSASRSPVYRRFVSRDFINPQISGWTCYDSAKMSAEKTIESGDIAAIRGHVVFVDKVGVDPFGLAKIKSTGECSKLSVRNFDFVVIQSSPDKGSLGINRFESRDYLAGGGAMATMFLGYAKAACVAKFDGKPRTAVTDAYGIIRHKQTPSCLAQRTKLVGEACVQNCSDWNQFQ